MGGEGDSRVGRVGLWMALVPWLSLLYMLLFPPG